jgi:Class II flagellar assembly regulator
LEINPTRKAEASSVRRTARPGHADTRSFAAEEMADAKTAAALTGSGPIAAMDAILALQGVQDSPDGRTRGIEHGEQLLALLDGVQDGLLAGGIPRAMLNRLALAIAKRQEHFTDPKLQRVLDEIDLRARVELAKLEQADSGLGKIAGL